MDSLKNCAPVKFFLVRTKMLEVAQHHMCFHASFKCFTMQIFGKELLL